MVTGRTAAGRTRECLVSEVTGRTGEHVHSRIGISWDCWWLLFSKRISMVWRAVEMGSKITEENAIGGVSPFCSLQLRLTVLL
jgi:hypothetical protein